MKLYKNRDWLYKMYVENDLSQKSIADLCGVNQSIIHRNLVKFGIPRHKFCGRSGLHCHLWKGGRIKSSQGYILVRNSEHLRADCRGYVPEQILIAEQTYGIPLSKREAVHHINFIKDDNRVENLYIFPSESHHQRYHQKFRKGSTLPITTSNIL